MHSKNEDWEVNFLRVVPEQFVRFSPAFRMLFSTAACCMGDLLAVMVACCAAHAVAPRLCGVI